MASGNGPLGDSSYAIWFHLDAIWRNNKPDKPNLFCVKLAFGKFEIELCGLELIENLPDMRHVLFARVRVHHNIVQVGNTEQV